MDRPSCQNSEAQSFEVADISLENLFNTTTNIKGEIHNVSFNDALCVGFLLLIVKIIKSFSL
jgi:hypothetical protein